MIRGEGDWEADALRSENKKLRALLKAYINEKKLLPGETLEDRIEFLLKIS